LILVNSTLILVRAARFVVGASMTLVALLSAGLILGLAFNVYGLLGLSLLIVPVYFVGSLHLGLPQAFASTFQAVTIFELAFFCGVMTQNLWLRRFVPDLQ
jgi:hypothetical protein